jgi:hypothetical protein
VVVTTTTAHASDVKCYTIKDPVKLSGTLDEITAYGFFPWYRIERNCKLGPAAYLCTGVTAFAYGLLDKATGLPISPQSLVLDGDNLRPGDSICYKVKCPQQESPYEPPIRFSSQPHSTKGLG